MKIQFQKAISAARTDIYAWSKEDDKSWMILRFDPQAHSLTGVFGEPSTGGLATVRPVKMASDDITSEAIEAFVKLGWAMASGQRLTTLATRKPTKVEANASAFADFLSKRDAKKKAPASVTDDHPDVELTADEAHTIRGAIAANQGAVDTWVPKRNSVVDIGRAMSGLEAIKMQKMIAKRQERLAVPDLDLDAARTALSSVSRPSSHAVHYYGTTSVDEQVQIYRRQAAASYPLLASMIAENPAIAKAVDDCVAIQPLLLERTGLDKASLKRIGALRTPLQPGALFENRRDMHGVDALGIDRQRSIMSSGALDLDEALRTLSAMPPDRTPKSDIEWGAFADLLAGCAIPLRNAYNVDVNDILQASKGNWKSYQESLARSADFDPEAMTREVVTLTTVDAMEVIDKFSRTAILPMLLHTIEDAGADLPIVSSEWLARSEEAAFRIITGKSKNIAGEVFETARRYAGRVPALQAAMGDPVETDRSVEGAITRVSRFQEDEFPVFAADFTASNGLIVAPFRNFAAFEQESRRLGHCVGQGDHYTRKAREGKSILFSVQSADRQTSYSTAELTGPRGDNVAEILANTRLLQHQGSVYNPVVRSVPEPAQLAYDEWFTALKANRLDHHAMAVKSWAEDLQTASQNANRTIVVNWSSVLEIDRKDEDVRNAVFEEWKYVIGGQVGKLSDPGAMFRFAEVRELLSSMSPETAVVLTERAKAEKAARDAEAEAEAPSM